MRNMIVIVVDGKKVVMKKFVQDMIEKSIVGMVTTLKGCEDTDEIQIHIKL
jgi:hypothetical protein